MPNAFVGKENFAKKNKHKKKKHKNKGNKWDNDNSWDNDNDNGWDNDNSWDNDNDSGWDNDNSWDNDNDNGWDNDNSTSHGGELGWQPSGRRYFGRKKLGYSYATAEDSDLVSDGNYDVAREYLYPAGWGQGAYRVDNNGNIVSKSQGGHYLYISADLQSAQKFCQANGFKASRTEILRTNDSHSHWGDTAVTYRYRNGEWRQFKNASSIIRTLRCASY